MSGARETPFAYEPAVTLAWNGDGSYTPECSICEWAGKAREKHADGVAACRSHASSAKHRGADHGPAVCPNGHAMDEGYFECPCCGAFRPSAAGR